MTESANWREVLGRIIQDTQQRQRIANALDINPVTLTRWANNTSTPRTQNLRQLLQALPEHSAAFMESLPDEVSKPFQDPEMMNVEIDTATISPLFYSRLVNAHCNLPSILRFSSLCDMILQQIIKHLDPHRVGLELTVVKCMPPSMGGKVRSSREITGRGTAPWDHELEHHTTFLGVESLAGYVINTGNARVIAERSDGFQLFPVVWDEHEQSSIAYPIMLGNTIAGCLLGSSTRSKFFLSRPHQILFAAYTKLLNLAFSAADYVPLEMVELYPMPLPVHQQQFLTHFRSRVAQIMIRNQLTVDKAEDEIWRQIEQDLLQYQMQHT